MIHPSALRRRLVGESRDLLELFLIPGLAAVLPWPLCFRLFQRLSRCAWLYREEADQALEGARSVTVVDDPRDWCAAHRLVKLIDHADLWLWLSRSRQWLDRHLTLAQGDWPREAAPLAITFHWGAGLWAIRHLARRGRPVAFLSVAIDRRDFAGQRIRYLYVRLRLWAVARIGGAPVIYRGNSVTRIRQALEQDTAVVGLIDVPPAPGSGSIGIALWGRAARLPRGLIRLAVAQQVTTVAFLPVLDRQNGERRLVVTEPLPLDDEALLGERLGQIFAEALALDPPAWHFWSLAPAYLAGCPRSGEAVEEYRPIL